MKLEQLTTLADATPVTGIKVNTLQTYSHRLSDFPKPVAQFGPCKLYDKSELAKWADARRARRNRKR